MSLRIRYSHVWCGNYTLQIHIRYRHIRYWNYPGHSHHRWNCLDNARLDSRLNRASAAEVAYNGFTACPVMECRDRGHYDCPNGEAKVWHGGNDEEGLEGDQMGVG